MSPAAQLLLHLEFPLLDSSSLRKFGVGSVCVCSCCRVVGRELELLLACFGDEKKKTSKINHDVTNRKGYSHNLEVNQESSTDLIRMLH